MIILISAVLISSCNNINQPIQANTEATETPADLLTFSLSNLFARPADSSLSCDILNIGTDEEITISVIATNPFKSKLTQDIELYVDSLKVETTNLTLEAGESEIIEFDLLWGNNEEGIYTVNIGGLQTIFGVG
jgi:PBP1b-binding outer membrane lipoprotein LpoB